MRNILLLFVFSMVSAFLPVYGQTAVALQSNGNATFYYSVDGFQKAYADAVNGDSIILSGGTFPPPSAINKQFTIIGAGHYPSATTATGHTVINGSIILSAGANNLVLEGLSITGSLYTNISNTAIEQLMVKRTLIGGSVNFIGNRTSPATGLSFINSVIVGAIDFSNVSNSSVQNSIIGSRISSSDGNLFRNTIFLFINALNVSTGTLYNCSNNEFHGNLFRQDNYRLTGGTSVGNVLKYNVVQASNPDFGTGAYLTSNWVDVNFSGLFENQEGMTFSYEHDYNLLAPNGYLDNENSQVGLYGGWFPYVEQAIPSIPHIVNKSVSSRTNLDGSIQVDVTVKAQDY